MTTPRLNDATINLLRENACAERACGSTKVAAAITLLLEWYERYSGELAALRAQVETLTKEIAGHRRHIQTAEINRNTIRNGAFKEAIEAVRETVDGNAYSVTAIRALISKSE